MEKREESLFPAHGRHRVLVWDVKWEGPEATHVSLLVGHEPTYFPNLSDARVRTGCLWREIEALTSSETPADPTALQADGKDACSVCVQLHACSREGGGGRQLGRR